MHLYVKAPDHEVYYLTEMLYIMKFLLQTYQTSYFSVQVFCFLLISEQEGSRYISLLKGEVSSQAKYEDTVTS